VGKRLLPTSNLQLCRDQWWRTPSHSYGNHQAQIRYSAKLRFLMGLTQEAVRDNGQRRQSGGAD